MACLILSVFCHPLVVTYVTGEDLGSVTGDQGLGIGDFELKGGLEWRNGIV